MASTDDEDQTTVRSAGIERTSIRNKFVPRTDFGIQNANGDIKIARMARKTIGLVMHQEGPCIPPSQPQQSTS